MRFRRNLIIVVGHGFRSDVLSDAQAWPTHTPNLDKLAQRGLRLIGTSACPADPGGMLSLMTGMHARQHGVITQDQAPLLCDGWPAQLQDADYHVVGVGRVGMFKQHLDQSVVVENEQTLEASKCAYLQAIIQRGRFDDIVTQRRQRLRYGPFAPAGLAIEPDDDIDGFIAQQATEALEKMPLDRPWALLVFFSGPGNDLPAPRLYNDLVEANDLVGDFVPADLSKTNILAELDYPRVQLQRLTRTGIADIRRHYLGRVGLIDHGIGCLAKALQTRSDHDRTWSVVTADRGQLLGEQGLIGHRSFLGPALEVPLIITPPTQAPPNRSTDDLISTTDVAATIAALAGCDSPPSCEGRSLLPLLAGNEMTDPFTGLISEFGHRLLLETERYKVIFNTEKRKALGLYDVLNDPDETQNLMEQPVASNLLDALRWRLADTLLGLRANQRYV